jgi:hypothetical protein
MRPRRESPTFSLSFLDVIACATGIVIFLTLLVLITTERSVPTELREAYDRARQEAPVLERTLREDQEFREKLKATEGVMKELAELTRQVETARQTVVQLQERAALEAQRRGLETALGRAQEPAPSIQLAQSVQDILTRRSPYLRTTAKRENVWFFFHKPGWVRVIERSNGEFRTNHFRRTTSLFGGRTTFEATNDGITVEELIATGGISPEKYAAFNPAEEYIGCYVLPDPQCHDDFIRVREILYGAGIEVGFSFELIHHRVLFGFDGSQSPVQ